MDFYNPNFSHSPYQPLTNEGRLKQHNERVQQWKGHQTICSRIQVQNRQAFDTILDEDAVTDMVMLFVERDEKTSPVLYDIYWASVRELISQVKNNVIDASRSIPKRDLVRLELRKNNGVDKFYIYVRIVGTYYWDDVAYRLNFESFVKSKSSNTVHKVFHIQRLRFEETKQICQTMGQPSWQQQQENSQQQLRSLQQQQEEVSLKSQSLVNPEPKPRPPPPPIRRRRMISCTIL